MQVDATQNGFWPTVERIEQFFDTAADTLNDEELFAAGYLQGHFAVVVSRLQSVSAHPEALHQAMLANLDTAFAANELAADDQVMVSALWNKIFHEMCQLGA